jgi:hypothetical protein
LQLCPELFRGSGAWRLRFSLAPCIHKVSQLLSLTPAFHPESFRGSEVCRSHEMFSTVSTVFLIDIFFTRAFWIRKKKVLLQYKEIFFDLLTPMHLLPILHSQFSAFAQQ